MVDVNIEIYNLVHYAIGKGLLNKRDKIFAINKILDVLKIDEYIEPKIKNENHDLDDILDKFGVWAVDKKIVEDDSIETLDLFDTKLMAQLIKSPWEVEKEFFSNYETSPMEATKRYYEFSKNTNYIREKRVKRDLKWKHKTQYGTLDITINLSKPEKDPRSIAKAKGLTASSYPKCLLCKENEGYVGRINHPARGNHRIIGIELAEESWYLQYSPYVYYNEHCIVLNAEHEAMKIKKKSFQRLLDFVELFPHYFIGSNADLPIVGGSILSHDHYQGGNYNFAMVDAKEDNIIVLKSGVEFSTLKWPMSVIRLRSKEKQSLVEIGYEIFLRWGDYSDDSVGILSHSDGNKHNSVTPISRFRNGYFELDLVLRNNRTSPDKPMGIFHPREEYHHIKRENIGLIEVMGLAVLPSRLQKEMEQVKGHILNGDIKSIESHNELNKHYKWSKELFKKHKFTSTNIDEILKMEIGQVFLHVLKDAGVFKEDKIGVKAFKRCREILLRDMV